MQIPCPVKIDCPGSDFPIENYSAESPDLRRYCVMGFAHADPPIGWNPPECTDQYQVYASAECCSTVSIADARLCAEQLAKRRIINDWWRTPGCDPPTTYCNTPQSATVYCDDGAAFTANVAACVIYASTQAEADAQALALAQKLAEERKFCCPPNDICCCVGQAFDRPLVIEGGTGPFTWTPDSGSWPGNITVTNTDADFRNMLLAGTAVAAGQSVVTYKIYNTFGDFLTKTFTIYALSIATTSLPSFTVGVAYSYQMQAVGGSGLYAWAILSGSLPAGLTMSLSGLISGTPTASTTATLVFEVIDLTCQTTDRTFFPPRIALSGTNRTTIATIKGFAPYSQTGTPPKKYKKLEWTGTSDQTAVTATTPAYACAEAKYIWSGASEIDAFGNYISHYRKDFYTQCHDATLPQIGSSPNFGLIVLKGYCYAADPGSCPSCPSPAPFDANVAANSINDGTDFIDDPTALVHTVTPTSALNNSSTRQLVLLQGTVNLPTSNWNGTTGPWVFVTGVHNYSSQLSSEYTDADALASATVWTGNGLVAQNLPRTTGFVSTFTTVQFRLNCTNLIAGTNYIASVDFWDSHFNHITQTYAFTATAPTYLITDNIPTPPIGESYEVRNPQIRFA